MIIFIILISIIINVCIATPINVTKIVIATSVTKNTIDPDEAKDIAVAHYNSMMLLKKKMQEIRNNTVVINNQSYPIEYKIWFNNSTQENIVKDYREMCEDPEIFVVILPIGKYAYDAVAVVSECNKLSISPGALSYDFYNSSYKLFQIASHPENMFDQHLPNQRYAKLNKVAILHANTSYLRSSCSISATKAAENELNITLSEEIIALYNVTSELRTAIHQIIDKAHFNGANAFLICAYQDTVAESLNYIYEKKYNFGAIAATPYRPGAYASIHPTISDYLFVPLDIHPSMSFSDDYFANVTEFNNEYRDMFKVAPHNSAWYFFYSGVLIYEGLANVTTVYDSTTFDMDSVMLAISRMNLPTISGSIEFDGNHRSKTTMQIAQMQNRTSTLVWPPIVSTKKLVLPIPTWEERVYHKEYTSSEWAIIGISIACILFSIFWILFVFYYRDHSIYRVSLPSFLFLINVGAIFIYISIFFWINHQVTVAACHLRIWFLAIGFCLLFGPLFAKNFQVWRMWSASLTSNVVITPLQLALIVMLIVGFQSVLLISFSASGDVKVEILIDDPVRPALNKELCTYNSAGNALIATMAAYGGILIVFGLVLTWGTRKVTFLAFNESKILLFSMYNVTFFSILALTVILNENNISPETAFILRSVCFIFSAFFTVLILLGNKCWLLLHNKDAKSRINSNKHAANNTTPSNNTHHTTTSDSNSAELKKVEVSSDNNQEPVVSISNIEFNQLKKAKKKLKKLKAQNEEYKQRILDLEAENNQLKLVVTF